MTAPPLSKPIWVCIHKNRFNDEMQARAAALVQLDRSPDLNRLFVYTCPYCRGWHLTRTKKSSKYKVTRGKPYNSLPTDAEVFDIAEHPEIPKRMISALRRVERFYQNYSQSNSNERFQHD
jgi:hypothetical protein